MEYPYDAWIMVESVDAYVGGELVARGAE